MNLTSLALIPLASAALLTVPNLSTPQLPEAPLAAPEFSVAVEVDETPAHPHQLERPRGVQGSHIQSSGKLDSGAAGLSSEDAWRQLFPRAAAKR